VSFSVKTKAWCYIEAPRINYFMLRIFYAFFVCGAIRSTLPD